MLGGLPEPLEAELRRVIGAGGSAAAPAAALGASTAASTGGTSARSAVQRVLPPGAPRRTLSQASISGDAAVDAVAVGAVAALPAGTWVAAAQPQGAPQQVQLQQLTQFQSQPCLQCQPQPQLQSPQRIPPPVPTHSQGLQRLASARTSQGTGGAAYAFAYVSDLGGGTGEASIPIAEEGAGGTGSLPLEHMHRDADGPESAADCGDFVPEGAAHAAAEGEGGAAAAAAPGEEQASKQKRVPAVNAAEAEKKHLRRQQIAREQKQRDLHSIRISSNRWEAWENLDLGTSSAVRCRRTVMKSPARSPPAAMPPAATPPAATPPAAPPHMSPPPLSERGGEVEGGGCGGRRGGGGEASAAAVPDATTTAASGGTSARMGVARGSSHGGQRVEASPPPARRGASQSRRTTLHTLQSLSLSRSSRRLPCQRSEGKGTKNTRLPGDVLSRAVARQIGGPPTTVEVENDHDIVSNLDEDLERVFFEIQALSPSAGTPAADAEAAKPSTVEAVVAVVTSAVEAEGEAFPDAAPGE